MDWRGARRSGNIEDRRGMGGGAIAGGGIGAMVLAAIGYFVFGIDPQTTMQVTEQLQGQTQQEVAQGQVSDANGQFVDAIETSNTEVWGPIFAAQGARYTPPEAVVLYDNATSTGCGAGQSAMGPFYCPADRKVYLDLTFWNELESKFGAKGEFAPGLCDQPRSRPPRADPSGGVPGGPPHGLAGRRERHGAAGVAG